MMMTIDKKMTGQKVFLGKKEERLKIIPIPTDYPYWRDDYFLSNGYFPNTGNFQSQAREDYFKMFASNISIRDGEYTKVIYTLVIKLVLLSRESIWS